MLLQIQRKPKCTPFLLVNTHTHTLSLSLSRIYLSAAAPLVSLRVWLERRVQDGSTGGQGMAGRRGAQDGVEVNNRVWALKARIYRFLHNHSLPSCCGNGAICFTACISWSFCLTAFETLS